MTDLFERLEEVTTAGLPADLDSPDWSCRCKCHDWKNYVPGKLRDTWCEISREARLVAFVISQSVADREEWD